MIGIYKITSPSGRVYVGQSRNIELRFKTYKSMKKSNVGQLLLHRSFLKHGVENHIFEIIEQCSLEMLNERERHWQDHYNVLNGGLNCVLTATYNENYVVSKNTKLKLSKAATGRILTDETKNKISKAHVGGNNYSAKKVKHRITGQVWDSAKQASDDLGIKYSTILTYLNGLYSTDIPVYYLDSDKTKEKKPLLIDTVDKTKFYSFKEASDYTGISVRSLKSYMSGARKNKTNLKYFKT